MAQRFTVGWCHFTPYQPVRPVVIRRRLSDEDIDRIAERVVEKQRKEPR